jgi:drug/metabolite transporter (DMT)-like permease
VFFKINQILVAVPFTLYTYPVMLMTGSALFLKEKITFRKISALISALTGAVVIIGAKGHVDFTGIILAVAAAVIYSVYILISSKTINNPAPRGGVLKPPHE